MSNPTSLPWYAIEEESQPLTPGLLVYPKRIEHNIEAMISLAGDVKRLIPHIKTHKMAEIVKMQMSKGIRQFKCATLSEVQLLIRCEVDGILLAHQPTAEKISLFLEWQKQYPNQHFSTLVDNEASLLLFSRIAQEYKAQVHLWIDINNGMNRTGCNPEKAFSLYKSLKQTPNCTFSGLHVYDGHIRPPDLKERTQACQNDFVSVEKLIHNIEKQGEESPRCIAGGSPSFYPHALHDKVMLSPGTTLLWDANYSAIWPESPFQKAAVIITRLISKPAKNIYCFDLGHKAVASEMPLPRVDLIGMQGSIQKGQSEEHLVVEYTGEDTFVIGQLFYAIPKHICPTVAKYNKVYVVHQYQITSSWNVEARDYQWEK
ncbi:MAG: D-TA family PLP-dependent enzyme [Flavobacteriaceae bacterium]